MIAYFYLEESIKKLIPLYKSISVGKTMDE